MLINFFGIHIITDPALFPRIGVRLAGFTIGPERLTQPPLTFDELPRIDLILLSHAHFDHFDLRTLRKFPATTKVISALRTSDLLKSTRLRDVAELRWNETRTFRWSAGELDVTSIYAQHWGARMQRDNYRGYNGYLLERRGRRILFTGDTAVTDRYRELRKRGPIDLAIVPIGAYDPWIRAHCTPEQAVEMMNSAGAKFIMPVHHQTFRLSVESFREPIERFVSALRDERDRVVLREIGETFVLP